MRIFESQRD